MIHLLTFNTIVKILSYLSPLDLCAVAESCSCLKYAARNAIHNLLNRGYYRITTSEMEFDFDQHRILRNFGDIISSVHIIVCDDVEGAHWRMTLTFDWLEQYVGRSLLMLKITSSKPISLPPSAVRLMSTVQCLEIFAPLHFESLRSALSNSKELNELSISSYQSQFDISSCLWSNSFPYLRKLFCVSTDSNSNQIKEFFRYHRKLCDLRLRFESANEENSVDLSFMKYLRRLEELDLEIESNVDGCNALTCLRNLKTFTIAGRDVATYTKVLSSLSLIGSVTTLTVGFYVWNFSEISEVDKVFHSIKSLTSLTELVVESYGFDFSQMAPKEIIEVIHNLTEIRIVRLDCDFKSNLDEEFFEVLVQVCASQERRITLIVKAHRLDGKHREFYESMNKNYGSFVEVKFIE